MASRDVQRTPWLSHADLLDHITILNAFHHLRTIRPEPEFLHMAIFRFELWIGRLQPITIDLDTIPPLDVLMVWHAYCLGSRWMYEDSRRMYPILKAVSFPLSLAASQYRRTRSTLHPMGVSISEKAIRHWFDSTNTAYHPTEYFESPSFRTSLCPRCESAIESRFTNRNHTGWAESYSCRLKCEGCRWQGTKADLAVHKLLRDIYSLSLPPLAEFDSMGGTLSTSRKLEDVEHAGTFNRLVTRCFASVSNTDVEQRLSATQAAVQTMKVLTAVPKISKTEGVNRMLSAYSVPEPFSLDLITFMKRQESFRNAIVSLGWNKAAGGRDIEASSRKNFSGLAINRACSRYQAFVELLKVRDNTSIDTCIPTWDIDLAWRTHQLKGLSYSDAMFGHLGKHTLTALFESTSKAWEKLYGVSYSQYPAPEIVFDKPEPLLKNRLNLSARAPSPPPVYVPDSDREDGSVVAPPQTVRFMIDGSRPSMTGSQTSNPPYEHERQSSIGSNGSNYSNYTRPYDPNTKSQAAQEIIAKSISATHNIKSSMPDRVVENVTNLSIVSESASSKISNSTIVSKTESARQIRFEDDESPRRPSHKSKTSSHSAIVPIILKSSASNPSKNENLSLSSPDPINPSSSNKDNDQGLLPLRSKSTRRQTPSPRATMIITNVESAGEEEVARSVSDDQDDPKGLEDEDLGVVVSRPQVVSRTQACKIDLSQHFPRRLRVRTASLPLLNSASANDLQIGLFDASLSAKIPEILASKGENQNQERSFMSDPGKSNEKSKERPNSISLITSNETEEILPILLELESSKMVKEEVEKMYMKAMNELAEAKLKNLKLQSALNELNKAHQSTQTKLQEAVSKLQGPHTKTSLNESTTSTNQGSVSQSSVQNEHQSSTPIKQTKSVSGSKQSLQSTNSNIEANGVNGINKVPKKKPSVRFDESPPRIDDSIPSNQSIPTSSSSLTRRDISRRDTVKRQISDPFSKVLKNKEIAKRILKNHTTGTTNSFGNKEEERFENKENTKEGKLESKGKSNVVGILNEQENGKLENHSVKKIEKENDDDDRDGGGVDGGGIEDLNNHSEGDSDIDPTRLMTIPIGKIGFVEGDEIRLLGAGHCVNSLEN
ncbi:uncharacterized protein MELLADRAFT_95202 [Melampsora larici-populina 98AG31]|uniref:Uncharacterized protein n=1 Tax=Melampsora larici-populina (strain 98AG31 / pathotype 3-4-7) TaxID=747676 RepID=F4RCH8_MELLP|nr:uncharacterized protein MELLADRAFT_95202 [Melampsora larici-populina 98AG31]EGG09738.1 hypothetical protein MELLADRAFT_95202 [Melampsora larici-populina 98AG31]